MRKEFVKCDVCNKEYDTEEEPNEVQEFTHIKFEGGYWSVFGDGVKVSIDICQCCLLKLLGEYCWVDGKRLKNT